MGDSRPNLAETGKLTSQEFEIMKSHTVIGGDTLRSADLEAGQDSSPGDGTRYRLPSSRAVGGKGYPKGLKAKEIPLAAPHHGGGRRVRCPHIQTPYKEPFSQREVEEYHC